MVALEDDGQLPPAVTRSPSGKSSQAEYPPATILPLDEPVSASKPKRKPSPAEGEDGTGSLHDASTSPVEGLVPMQDEATMFDGASVSLSTGGGEEKENMDPPPLAGPGAPYWPEPTPEAEARRQRIAIENTPRDGNLYVRSMPYKGKLRTHAGTQTQTSEFMQVRELQNAVVAARKDLLAARNRLRDVEHSVLAEHATKLAAEVKAVETRAREKLEWMRQEYEEKAKTQRMADRTMMHDAQVERAKKDEDRFAKSMDEARGEWERERRQLEKQVEDGKDRVMTKEAEVREVKQQLTHMREKMAVQRVEMDAANYEPQVRELRDANTKATEELARVRQEVKKLKEDVKDKSTEIGRIRTRIFDKEREVKELKGELNASQEGTLQALERQKEEHEAQIADREAEVSRNQVRLKGLQEDYHRECSLADIISTRQREALEKLAAENQRLRKDLERMEERQRLAGHRPPAGVGAAAGGAVAGSMDGRASSAQLSNAGLMYPVTPDRIYPQTASPYGPYSQSMMGAGMQQQQMQMQMQMQMGAIREAGGAGVAPPPGGPVEWQAMAAAMDGQGPPPAAMWEGGPGVGSAGGMPGSSHGSSGTRGGMPGSAGYGPGYGPPSSVGYGPLPGSSGQGQGGGYPLVAGGHYMPGSAGGGIMDPQAMMMGATGSTSLGGFGDTGGPIHPEEEEQQQDYAGHAGLGVPPPPLPPSQQPREPSPPAAHRQIVEPAGRPRGAPPPEPMPPGAHVAGQGIATYSVQRTPEVVPSAPVMVGSKLATQGQVGPTMAGGWGSPRPAGASGNPEAMIIGGQGYGQQPAAPAGPSGGLGGDAQVYRVPSPPHTPRQGRLGDGMERGWNVKKSDPHPGAPSYLKVRDRIADMQQMQAKIDTFQSKLTVGVADILTPRTAPRADHEMADYRTRTQRDRLRGSQTERAMRRRQPLQDKAVRDDLAQPNFVNLMAPPDMELDWRSATGPPPPGGAGGGSRGKEQVAGWGGNSRGSSRGSRGGSRRASRERPLDDPAESGATLRLPRPDGVDL